MGEDEGQLLVLAGMVLILAFLVAVYGVSELASQKNRLAQGPQNDLATLFREERDKVASSLHGLVVQGTDNSTLLGYVNSTKDEVEQKGRGHGLSVLLSLGNRTEAYAAKSEYANFTADDATAQECPNPAGAGTVTRKYTAWSFNGSRDFRPLSWDCGDDAVLWDRDAQVIQGAVLHLFLASPTARLDDTFVIALN